MKKLNYIVMTLVLMLGITSIGGYVTHVHAQDTEESIVNRMKERTPQVNAMKESGKIGENLKGLLSLLEADDEARRLVNTENKDRQTLFAIIVEQDPEATLEIVSEVYRERMYDNAKFNYFLQDEDGKFKRKSELVE